MKHRDWLIGVVLYVVCSFLFFSSTVGVMNSLDAPEYALTQALVEKQSSNIDGFDRYAWPDIAHFEGKTYSVREPGLSFLAMPPYKLATLFSGDPVSHQTEMLTYGFMGMILALGPLLAWMIGRELGYSRFASAYAGVLFGAGTLYWKYSASFVRQPFTALFFLLALLLLLKIRAHKNNTRTAVLLFITLGCALIVDNLSVFVVGLYTITFFSLVRRKFNPLIFLAGIAPLVLFAGYNFLSFGEVFTSPRLYAVLPAATHLKSIFIAELRWTIPLNLFSYKPIPPEAFNFLKAYPQFMETYSMYKWASIWQYKGILVLTPPLVLGFFGWFVMKKRWFGGLLGLAFLAYFIPASKFFVFFNPTAYDTRYVIPAVVFLILGVPATIDYFHKRLSHPMARGVLLVILLCGLFVSVAQAVFAVSQHFAPHVTGEHRFDYVAQSPLSGRIELIVRYAFPNIGNLHIYCAVLVAVLALAGLYKKIYGGTGVERSVKKSGGKGHHSREQSG